MTRPIFTDSAWSAGMLIRGLGLESVALGLNALAYLGINLGINHKAVRRGVGL